MKITKYAGYPGRAFTFARIIGLAAAGWAGGAGISAAPAFAQDTTVFAHDSAGAADNSLPAVQTQGQTEFLSGGIGKDESDAIKRVAGSWPLMLEFAQLSAAHGEYLGDVQVTIRDAAGNTVLETTADGPYLLAKLPPGKYAVDAVYESKKLHRHFSIQKGESRKITLLWPASSDRAPGQQPAEGPGQGQGDHPGAAEQPGQGAGYP